MVVVSETNVVVVSKAVVAVPSVEETVVVDVDESLGRVVSTVGETVVVELAMVAESEHAAKAKVINAPIKISE